MSSRLVLSFFARSLKHDSPFPPFPFPLNLSLSNLDDKQLEAGNLVRDLELLIWSPRRSTFDDMDDRTRIALADRDREILPKEDIGLFVKQKTHWARRNGQAVVALPDRDR